MGLLKHILRKEKHDEEEQEEKDQCQAFLLAPA